MSLPSKLAGERNQKALVELVTKPGNDICADCKVRNPRWASHNLGIFICMNCASIHRKIGTHITKVKSLTMDLWTNDQVDVMRNMGNVRSNAIYNPNELRNPPPPNIEDGERDSEMEKYIRSKYEYRKYIDKNALVRSKLGPSRGSSDTPRSVSSPLTNHRASTLPSSSSASNVVKTEAKTPSIPTSRSIPSSGHLAPQPRSVSHPAVAPQIPPQQKPQAPAAGSVWNDLIQLQDAAPSASLPLQYQQPTFSQQPGSATGLTPSFAQQSPLVTGSSLASNPTGLGFNPFQQQQFQQQQQPFSATPSFASNTTPFTPSFQYNQSLQQPQQGYGQQLFMSQTGLLGAQAAQPSAQFFQPQPQSAAQLQAPASQGFLTPSPSQGMMSAPPGQSHFMTPSPNQQFHSHSPQPQMQMQPTGMFMTPSPQPMGGMMGGSHSPQPGMMGNQFTSMQQPMQQQQQFGQQQQGQFLQGLPDSMLSPANFQAGMNGNQAFGNNPFHRSGTF
ncbi:hypothetical protein DFP72DRAFT_991442 [Ephemerocybe angulata]|uniref:Arf-GAP domain-containing protein n=1 Tax=Ephemerocybe angulata TaxID=980116 RepID=A0A8H6M0Q2_9AGAR|nr:hypothetical protein DFP72DRAFT_991442 [Tulosesus angulatus]